MEGVLVITKITVSAKKVSFHCPTVAADKYKSAIYVGKLY